MHSAITPEFKVLVLGDKGVGKTTIIRQYNSNSLYYTPTISIPIGDALTTYAVVFHELSSTIHPYEDYTVSALGASLDGAILMFDVTRPETYFHLEEWYEVIAYLTRKELPIVLCGNKIDLIYELRVHPHHITFHAQERIPYFESSQTALYNLNAPVWRLVVDAHSDRARKPAHRMMCRSYLAQIEYCHEASMIEYDQYKQELGQSLEMLRSPGCRVYESSVEVRLCLDHVLKGEILVREFFTLIHRKCVRFILRPSQETGEELLRLHVCFGEDVNALRRGVMHLRMLVTALMIPPDDREA
ncbi:P-loop containing nucleoside triphosphate hydrolase protein [Aspergillus floccosus]